MCVYQIDIRSHDAHRNAYIRLCKSWRVVYAITDHYDDLALRLVLFDDADLVFWQEFRTVANSKRGGLSLGRALIVAGQQLDPSHTECAATRKRGRDLRA